MDGVNPAQPEIEFPPSTSSEYDSDEEDEEDENDQEEESILPHTPLAFGKNPRAEGPTRMFSYVAPKHPLPRPGLRALERETYEDRGYIFHEKFLEGYVIGMARAWNPTMFDFFQAHHMSMEDIPRAIFNLPRPNAAPGITRDDQALPMICNNKEAKI
jgi:hypothetical protein